MPTLRACSMSILIFVVLAVKVLVSHMLTQWLSPWRTLSVVIVREGIVEELWLVSFLNEVLLVLRKLLKLRSLGLTLRVSVSSVLRHSVLLGPTSCWASESWFLSIKRLLVVEASLLVKSSSLISILRLILVFSPDVLIVPTFTWSDPHCSYLSPLLVVSLLSYPHVTVISVESTFGVVLLKRCHLNSDLVSFWPCNWDTSSLKLFSLVLVFPLVVQLLIFESILNSQLVRGTTD